MVVVFPVPFTPTMRYNKGGSVACVARGAAWR